MSTVSDYFGCMVFDDRVMKANLSADVYASLRRTIDEGAKLDASCRQRGGRCHEGLGCRPWRDPLYPLVPAADRHHRRKARQLHFLPLPTAASSWISPAKS